MDNDSRKAPESNVVIFCHPSLGVTQESIRQSAIQAGCSEEHEIIRESAEACKKLLLQLRIYDNRYAV